MIFLKLAVKHEVKKIINCMKNKNGGIDKIREKIFKVISGNVSDTLVKIFNDYIEKLI